MNSPLSKPRPDRIINRQLIARFFHYAIVLAAINLGPCLAGAVTWYVSPGGSDATAGTNWPTAKLTIQAAVNAATNGDIVLVTNGIYATGATNFFDGHGTASNRVAITKGITVWSVNGAAVTTIMGAKDFSASNQGEGPASVRCVFVATNAVIAGFTLANGSTEFSYGGGVYCPNTSGIISNCIITGNLNTYGAGTYGGTLENCLLAGNTEVGSGGGGAYKARLINCTVVGNSTANYEGGGIDQCSATNCIIYNNTASVPAGANYANGGGNFMAYCCTTPLPPAFMSGPGNITNAPVFVATNNFRLSPFAFFCVNAGLNDAAPGAADLDGNPRIFNGTVDMGCYENALNFSQSSGGYSVLDVGSLNLALAVVNHGNSDSNTYSVCSQAQIAANFQNGVGSVTNMPNNYGLYTLAQVQALNVGSPLLARDTNGQFKLTIAVQRSTNMTSFTAFPMTAPQTTINGQGALEFQFTPTDNAAFYRVQSQ